VIEELTALVVCGGAWEPGLELVALKPDLVVAADGGAEHLSRFGLTADLLVGDFDSITADTRATLEAGGTEIREFPRDKDKTDTEIAIDVALEHGATHVVLACAFGGRPDHTVMNMMLLASRLAERAALSALGAGYDITAVRGTNVITGARGDVISLIAVSDDVRGVTTSGLRWELRDGTLGRGSSLGVSNVMVGQSATVSTTSGILIAVHLAQGVFSGVGD